ncbi:MAG: protein-L-isoaspartate O-methyltransferase [Rhodobacteraceae bacterium]|nr:protein-L-isoaspartate O-methyltransferase [Paracoccaceae bacterium]
MVDFDTCRRVMVDSQVRPSDVTKFPIIEAMLKIPREAFVPDSQCHAAYMGDHVELAEGRVLLDPRMFAKMLESLDIRSDEFVLDIGSGFGCSSAVIAHMAEAVVALEQDPTMAENAAAILAEHEIDNAVAVTGTLSEGAPQYSPYDVITIQGGIERLPDAIGAQLREGGRIAAIFVQSPPGECRIGIKQGGRINWRMSFNAHAPVLAGFENRREFAL